MKKILTTLLGVIITIVFSAQPTNDNTLKFLGHPVDGSKSKMEEHLISKGFTYNSDYDSYSGIFNGKNVNVFISTNNNNVDRIYVAFNKLKNEADIINEYNTLLRQFKRNEKYIYLSENLEIPTDEDISFELSVHNKTYEASFYLKPQLDTLAIVEEFTSLCSEEQLEKIMSIDFTNLDTFDFSENADILQILLAITQKSMEYLKGCVWFRIHKQYGRYHIGLYYDNLNNRPNGEDL